jgi:Protein of unknown function (DUF3231)
MDLNPMDIIKPIQLSTDKLNESEPMTAVEMGKLWATYTGNSMSFQILTCFLQNCEDEHIKVLLENGIALTKDFMQRIEGFFHKNNFPIPRGFTEDDVNHGAPRLYDDAFYVHYLKYASKAGMSIYAVAIPLVMRKDIKDFFMYCNECSMILLEQINTILFEKNLIAKPPILPIPKSNDFIKKQNYLAGFVGDIRPLHALEISHLYDNIENNTTSKALLLGFYQGVKDEKIKALFKRGLDMTEKSVKQFMEKLHVENLPTPSYIDHLVTPSTYSPFSDKIMLFHKVDMFSIKIRSFANSIAVNGRRDIALMYGRNLMNVGLFVDDGANLLIENGWMESPPKAVERK